MFLKIWENFLPSTLRFVSHSASSQAEFATLFPSLVDDIALIPCLCGAKTVTLW